MQEDIDIPIKLYLKVACVCVKPCQSPTKYPVGTRIVLTTWALEDEDDFQRNRPGCSEWIKTPEGIAHDGEDTKQSDAERFGAFAAECLRFDHVAVFMPDDPIPVVSSRPYAHPDHDYGKAPPPSQDWTQPAIAAAGVVTAIIVLAFLFRHSE